MLVVPFAAVTDFVDPGGRFQPQVPGQWRARTGMSSTTSPENDLPVAEPVEDGSNVVSVDFTRKK